MKVRENIYNTTDNNATRAIPISYLLCISLVNHDIVTPCRHTIMFFLIQAQEMLKLQKAEERTSKTNSPDH